MQILLRNHKLSVLLAASAVLFYLLFELLVPELYYSAAHPLPDGAFYSFLTAAVQLKAVAPVIALLIAAGSVWAFVREAQKAVSQSIGR